MKYPYIKICILSSRPESSHVNVETSIIDSDDCAMDPSPLRGWRQGSMATLWCNSESSEAVMSCSSLCHVVGKSPIGQIMAWLVVNAVPQLFGSNQP